MNASLLLEHYARIADAPDAIARLRRFVLDLAVRGKLVEQDGERAHRDGPDGPFAIPSDWCWRRIGDELELLNGMAFKPTDWVPSGLPIVRIQNLNNPLAPFNFCDPVKARHRSLIDDGAFLISWSGTPGTSFGAFIWRRGAAVLNQHIFRCDFKTKNFDPDFLQLAINGRLDEMIAKAHGGVGLQHITKGKLEAMLVARPPLAEQHRIVAKVDELMALCDQLEAARAEREAARDTFTLSALAKLNAPDPATFGQDARFALANLAPLTTRPDQIKQLRQTILNLAVRGKLVEHDVVQHIPTRIGDHTEVLPATWSYLPLEHLLSEDTRNGYSRRPDDAPNGAPILRISAGTVRSDGLIAEEEHKLISGIDQRTREQYGLYKGDLLACRFNGNKAYVGRMTLFADYIGNQPIYPDKLIRVRCDKGIAGPEFVRLASESDLVRNEIEGYCATTVGNWGISAGKLKQVRFPVPPLAEQHRIVAKVDELMALCDQLGASITTDEQTRSRLLEAVLHNALEPA